MKVNFVSLFLRKIPLVRNFFSPDGVLSGGSDLPVNNAKSEIKSLHSDLSLVLGSDAKLDDSSKYKSQNLTRVFRVKGIIKRKDLINNPNIIFLFGDNVDDHNKHFNERLGRGGQASEMAGERNSLGIPTLWKAAKGDESSYFNDSQLDQIKAIVDKSFAQIKPNMKVVVPVDENGNLNLGTGIAQLTHRAPKVLKYIESKIEQLAA